MKQLLPSLDRSHTGRGINVGAGDGGGGGGGNGGHVPTPPRDIISGLSGLWRGLTRVGDGGGEGAVDGGGEGLGVQGEEAAHWLSRPRGVDGDEGSGGGSAHARRLWSGRLAAGLPPTVKGGQRGVGSMAGADDDDREEGEEEEGVGDDNMMVTPLGATDAVSRAAPSTGKYSHGALEVASRHALAQHEQGSRALAQHTCEALPAASRCTLCQNELARAEAAGAWAGEQYECRRCLNLSELLQQLHTNCVQAMHEAEQAVVYQQHLQLDLHQRLQDERQACEQALAEQATLMQDKVRVKTELETAAAPDISHFAQHAQAELGLQERFCRPTNRTSVTTFR